MTIAQQINWDFKTNDELEIRDKNGNQIYCEDSNGFWVKMEYNSDGNEIYYESSSGFWKKYEYDSQGSPIYLEDSSGYWSKWEYNSDADIIYYEDSNGNVEDNRPKTCEDKIIEIDGVKYKLVKV